LTISEERKRRVIDVYYNQGKATREIAKIERMSICDISTIIKEKEARRRKYEHQQQQVETSGKAYELFFKRLVNVVEIAIHKLPYMENLYGHAKDQVEKMQCTLQRLANNIMALEYKISILDKTAFSCEQDCKIKEQQIQELTAQHL
jgi:transposase